MNGTHHHTYGDAGTQQVQQLPAVFIWRPGPRCLGRMSGPLAGIVATRLLEDYDTAQLCTACVWDLSHEPRDAAAELARWGTLLAWQQRARRRCRARAVGYTARM